MTLKGVGNDTDNCIQTETILEQHTLREKNGTVCEPKREIQKCAAIFKKRLIGVLSVSHIKIICAF